ncbi:polysaccharide deacetylase family protein [Actinoplanes sp. NPDC048988]|uniref:polysaccharide deacetylase family protein n=1 Tax=Actinoplanes sp. NPDC048988 TaxID=3363901 RepID=UPI003715AFB7
MAILRKAVPLLLISALTLSACSHGETRAPGETPAPSPSSATAAPSTPAPPPSSAPVSPSPSATASPTASASPSATARGSGPAGSLMTTGSAAVALTFDDGPDPVQTPKMLALLAQYHIKATFCLIGENVRRNPELVRRIVAAGHTLCDHTWSHSLTIGKQPAAVIESDLRRTADAIHAAAPNAELKYFRAPGGNFTPRLVGVAARMGMTSLYWKVDPRDWSHPRGETHQQHQQRVIDIVLHRTHRGAIVLSHDFNQPDTIAAYRTIIPALKKRGLNFVAL